MLTMFTHLLWSRSARAVVLPIILVLSGIFGATTALAKTDRSPVPFKGTLQAVESVVGVNPGPPLVLSIVANGSGQGTQLGRFSYSYTVILTISSGFTGTGTTHYDFVAANGDHLYSLGDGFGTVADGMPEFNHVVEHHTITGGTGRFAGATGSYTIDRLINHATSITTGTIDGNILLANGH